jgi:hypothetical protein
LSLMKTSRWIYRIMETLLLRSRRDDWEKPNERFVVSSPLGASAYNLPCENVFCIYNVKTDWCR